MIQAVSWSQALIVLCSMCREHTVSMWDALVVVFCVCFVFSEKEESLLPFLQSLFRNILRENVVCDLLSPRQCVECSHWFYGFRSKGTQTEGDVELYHCKNIQQFLASVLLWAALLNLINYSQMTANSSQIAYLSASLLDTSPASHPFSTQCTSTSFQSLFCLRNHSIFPDLLAVLRNLQFYYSF